MEQQELDLRHYLGVLWQGKWLILLTTLVALGGVLAFSRQEKTLAAPSYRATATIMAEANELSIGFGGSLAFSEGDRNLNTQIQLINSRNVMERALAKLQDRPEGDAPNILTVHVEALQSAITVRPIVNTNLLEITARASTPGLAEQRAEAVVAAYIDYLKAERTRAIEDALENISAQIEIARQPGVQVPGAAVLLLRLETEIAGMAQLVDRTARELEKLQERAPSGAEPPFHAQTLRIEIAATELSFIYRDLQQVLDRVSGTQRLDSQAGRSPLDFEIPRIQVVATELTSIAQGLLGVQEGLRRGEQQTLQAASSPLKLEAPLLEQVTKDLTAFSQALQRVQNRLKGEQQPVRKAAMNPLRLQAPLLESMATEAGELSKELKDIQRAAAEIDPGQVSAGVASQVERARASLEQVSRDMSQIQTTSLDMARQFSALRNYTDSVVDDLDAIARKLRDVADYGVKLTQTDRDSLPSRVKAHALGLQLAIDDLGEFRGPDTDVGSYVRYGQLLRAEGQIRAVIIQLNKLATELESNAKSTSVDGTLAEIRDRVQGTGKNLEQVLKRFQGLGPAPDVQRERSVADQARSEMENIALTLDIAARQLRELPLGGLGLLLEARLSAVAERLATAQANARGASERLSAIAKGGSTIPDGALAEGLAVVQQRIQQNTDSLRTTLENLQIRDSLPSGGQETDTVAQDYRQTATIALSLEIASRQLWMLLSGRIDPLLEVELGLLAEQLTRAQGSIGDASKRLSAVSAVRDTTLATGLAVVQGRIQESAERLETTLEMYRTQDNALGIGEGADAVDLAYTETANIVRSLDIASRQLEGLLQGNTDPLLAGELGSLAARLVTAEAMVNDISDRTATIDPGGGATVANSLAMVQGRIQRSTDALSTTLESLRRETGLLSLVRESDAANQAHIDTTVAALSLDIAVRQLQGVMRERTDPVLLGELSSLSERVSAAWSRVQSISDELKNLAGDDGAAEASGGLALTQNRLDASSNILRTASEVYVQLSEEAGDEVLQNIAGRIRDRFDIGAGILRRVTDDLERLQISEADPLRYGQLVVVEERVREASAQASEISAQLQRLQGRQGPGYQDLLRLQQELELSRLNPQDTGITLVDSAVRPEAIRVSRSGSFFSKTRFPLGAAAGLLLGALGVFLRDQMDQTVRTQRRLRDQVGLAPLGVVPKGKIPARQHLPMVTGQDSSTFSEALQMVGVNLSGPLNDGVRSFLITSATAKEGKTMLAVNLAHRLAQYGRKVLLVDGNLRKPDVARVLKVTQEEGLSTALEQGSNPADYIVQAGDFFVLPGGKPPANPVELLSSPDMGAFLRQAQQEYDVVLVDSPPETGFAETKALAKEVDGVILVIRAGAASVESLKESKEDLEAAGAKMVGGVLNFASSSESSHLRHERYGPRRSKDQMEVVGKISDPPQPSTEL